MSRADRIVNRRAWAAMNPWKKPDQVKSGTYRSWRAWLFEWRMFRTHDRARMQAMAAQQRAFAEARAASQTAG